MKIERYIDKDDCVLFRLTNNVRYYYKLHRSKTNNKIAYTCFKYNEIICIKEISHIDDFYAYFFINDTEKIIERLYEKAHIMAKKALINAYVNGN